MDLRFGKINSGVSDGEWIEKPSGGELVSVNPSTGEVIARVLQAGLQDYERVATKASEGFKTWRVLPAPKRGEIVRQIAEELRLNKKGLAVLVTLEMGKIIAEAEGEVQEMIDICDYAVGLSRQLYGITLQSERAEHRLFEQWHPLGPVGVITAFNFPISVWAWNAAIAAVCGDTLVWKPSSSTPLASIAIQNICNKIMARNGLNGIFNLVVGSGETIGEKLINDRRFPLISATGSCTMGHCVSEAISKRLGRVILELGGNNAVVVLNDANLKLAERAILFGAIGTAGQRCTSIRRLIIQKKIAGDLTERLLRAYRHIKIGDPLKPTTLMGPLVNQQAVDTMMNVVKEIKSQGGEIIYGGKKLDRSGYFVEPMLVKVNKEMSVMKKETFAPILYLIEVESVEEAIEVNNNVPQGLSSAIFSNSLNNVEKFLSSAGSDCGIVNVNNATSGAEIGGAFGGEKETGGGREAGSDAWKGYMRRQTCTINWSLDLPLAQGVEFGD